jgi:hypothetical protein
MRGVVTLAAAAAIPIHADDGSFIPGRPTLQLAAYTVAIGTLLLQGLTLPSLIRRLGVTNEAEKAEDDAEEARTRLLAARAAASVVEEQVKSWSDEIGREQAERVARVATQAVLAREAAAATLLRPEAVEEMEEEEDDSTPPFPRVDGPLAGWPGPAGIGPSPGFGPGAGRELGTDGGAGAERASGQADATPSGAETSAGNTPPADNTPSAGKAPTADNTPPAGKTPPTARGEAKGAGTDAEPGAGAEAPPKSGAYSGLRRKPSRGELLKRAASTSVRAAELRKGMIRAQRAVVVAERNAGRLNDAVMRRMLRELDLEEESMDASWTNRL